MGLNWPFWAITMDVRVWSTQSSLRTQRGVALSPFYSIYRVAFSPHMGLGNANNLLLRFAAMPFR
jgi:hypothetical protein